MLGTLYIGKKIIELDVIDSTNSFISDLISQNTVIEGTTVVAHYQNAGKGQRGNIWFSEPGKNLTFSIALKPVFLESENAFLLSKAVSLAICNCLESVTKRPVFIKWPNDIYINDKKVCGILIENQFKGSRIEYAVVGIGLNVNQTNFENTPFASSLKLVVQKEIELESLFHIILKKIEFYYQKLRKGAFFELEEEYLSNLLFLDENRKYKTEKGFIIGRVTNVLSNGKLEITTRENERLNFDMKEISFLF